MSVYSRYTNNELNTMSLRQFFFECKFDNIIEATRFLRVARYTRESTNHEDQVKALENQIERVDAFIAGKPYFTIEEKHKYTERGISGRTVKDRVAFKLMLEAARRREFDIIVVQDVCRFARNLRELLNTIEELKSYDVGVLILDGKYWTFNMDETDIVRLAIDGGMAQGESMRTSKRVNNGVESYRKRGQLVVSGLFGYEYVKAVERRDNTFRIHPVQGLVVKTIFDLYTHPDVTQRMGSQMIANYLVEHKMVTAKGDIGWTASKVNRVLKNEKYMGYMLYGKYKNEDTMTKKQIATKIEPIREDVLDKDGNVVQKCNLIKGDWEPIVSEEQWWFAHAIRKGRAAEYIYSRNGNVVNGLRESVDVIANKSFCQCGYSLSPQYVHVATVDKEAQIRYKCRHQINSKSKAYQVTHKQLITENQCDLPAVSETKMWLMSIKVFERVFTGNREDILKTLTIVKKCKELAKSPSNGVSLEKLQQDLEKVETQLDNLYCDKLAGEIDDNTFKRLSVRLQSSKEDLEFKIKEYNMNVAKIDKDLFDLKAIETRLNSYVDFSGKKISEELLDMFVERIIYREGDEFVWELNLSGIRNDARTYRIGEYSKEYEEQLKSDDTFDIIDQFMISLEDCREYMESEKIKRRFVPKFWRPITVKIAVK
ncbi:MAG: recombinase family protein [Alphaproteobacteria bacterium]|nr:recombinase family protein [Alphaproteobacteria bacterium]